MLKQVPTAVSRVMDIHAFSCFRVGNFGGPNQLPISCGESAGLSERDRGKTSFTTPASKKGNSSSSGNIKSLLIRCLFYIIELSLLPSVEMLFALNSCARYETFIHFMTPPFC